jgi:cytochrome c551/c552
LTAGDDRGLRDKVGCIQEHKWQPEIGGPMADHHAAAAAQGHPDMDYAEHERTYRQFLQFVKYGTVGVIAIVILLAVLTL